MIPAVQGAKTMKKQCMQRARGMDKKEL